MAYPNPPEIRQLTRDQIDRGITTLRKRIAEVRALDSDVVRYDDAQVETVESNIQNSILEIFGPNSPEYKQYSDFDIWHGGYNTRDPRNIRQIKFATGIPQSVTKLEGLISRLEERREDALEGDSRLLSTSRTVTGSRRVFVVHGHDEAAKETVSRFLQRLDLEPIVLHEQASEGKAIIEKIETHAEVDFAVVLLTPDDAGYRADAPGELKPRARQNVIFEFGYFIGRLGRGRVCALYKSGVELPSDVDGVVYVSMDDPHGWRLLLAREIKAAGVQLDLNRAI